MDVDPHRCSFSLGPRKRSPMARLKTKRLLQLLAGWVIFLIGLLLLWFSEVQFDLYRAAAATSELKSPNDAPGGSPISWTGPMDPGLSIPGEYIDTFDGFLAVSRKVDIYGWHRRGNRLNLGTSRRNSLRRWSLRWRESLEDNSRNDQIQQQCKPREFRAPEYRVGTLPIDQSSIQFADIDRPINPRSLKVSETGTRLKLTPQYALFYLAKGRASRVGDERVRYTGIPVPRVATYFGKIESGRGTVYRTRRQTGLFHLSFQDAGDLHHIVAGDRQTALATIRSIARWNRWTERGISATLIVVGCYLLISWMTGFLFHLPTLAWIVETGTFVASLAIGSAITMATILAAYLIAHPLLLPGIAMVLATTIGLIWKRGRGSQDSLRRELEAPLGRPLGAEELKELEFAELARLAMCHGSLHNDEIKLLRKWAKQHRWDQAKYDAMLEQARDQRTAPGAALSSDDHLCNLIRLAMADGTLSGQELQLIRKVSKRLGYDDRTIDKIIDRTRGRSDVVMAADSKRPRRRRKPLRSTARRKK